MRTNLFQTVRTLGVPELQRAADEAGGDERALVAVRARRHRHPPRPRHRRLDHRALPRRLRVPYAQRAVLARRQRRVPAASLLLTN